MAPWQLDKKKKRRVDAYGRPVPEAGIETFPVGEDLVGFESLTPGQQEINQALVDALSGGLGGAPSFQYPSFEYPAAPTFPGLPGAPPIPSMAPTPIDMPPFAYEGVSPADVGNLQDMLASMPGISPEVQQTLSTLMQGAGARPEQTLEEIIASIPTFGGELGGETGGALARALSGEFPSEYFQKSIAGPAREQFREETAPGIREEFAGPGTFWGTARAGAVTKERGKMEQNLAAISGQLGHQAQERSLQAATISMNARQNQIQMALQELAGQRNLANAQQVTALNAAISQLEAEQNNQIAAANELNRLSQGKYQEIALAQGRWETEVGALQQQQQMEYQGAVQEAQMGQQAWATGLQGQLQQQAQQQQGYQQSQAQAQQLYVQEMQTAYDNYIRQNPAMAENLQAALNYLNIPILTTYQEYEETGGGGPSWRIPVPERPPGIGLPGGALASRLRR